MTQLAALYARVSTLQQEQEATIDSQIAAIEQYAQAHDYQLQKDFYFLDQAVSGAKLERPGLDRLRDLAAEGLFQTVLCLDPDRLSRVFVHQRVLLDDLHRAGVTVCFINQPAVENTPQGQLLMGIQGLFAEYERAMITERLRRGKLYRVRQGELDSPVAPYGYRYIPVGQPGGGRWQVHPTEASVVQQIYQWYTTEDDLTIWKIVERLNDLGEKAPPRGKRWQFSTVQAILKQANYTGQGYYNRTYTSHQDVGQAKRIGRGAKRFPRHMPRPREEWIPTKPPALITQETWQKAQEQLAMKQKFAQRNNKQRFYLLRSLLVCGVCGRSLVGRTSGQRITYACNNVGKQRNPDVPQHSCVISAQVVEPLVWDAVCELLRNPALLSKAWDHHSDSQPAVPGEEQRLQKRQKALERQRERLVDLYQEEQIDKADFTRRKIPLDQELASLQQRLQQLEHREMQADAREQMLEDFASYCHRIEANLKDPTPELQQEVIRLLIDHVMVGEDEIVIKHIVPTDDDCRLLPGRR
jgi:site-specific DNA recombinase